MIRVAAIAIVLLFTAGCGLMPKRVEYFQREVQAVPKKPDALVDSEKQGARLTADLVEAARIAAWAEAASTNVINPLEAAAPVSRAVSGSLGQPKEKWTAEAAALADRIDSRNAKLDAEVEDYRVDVARDVGKKIEGTGLFRIPWLLNGLLWIGIPLVLFWVGRLVLNVYAPPIGIALGQVERMAVGTLKRAAEQTWSGLESFKSELDGLDLDDQVKGAIKALLRRRLVDNQDPDVQAAIKRITN